LLRIHHDEDPENETTATCLNEAFRVIAQALSDTGEVLTESLLREKIPAWVYQWAVARDWLEYPPPWPRWRTPSVRKNISGLEPILERELNDREPIPERELNVRFGVYWVSEAWKWSVVHVLERTIADWEREATERARWASEEPRNGGEQEHRSGQVIKGNPAGEASDLRAQIDAYIEEVFQKPGNASHERTSGRLSDTTAAQSSKGGNHIGMKSTTRSRI